MNILRWKCVCAYDGGPFAGWQSQAGGNSVQDKIEARLAEIFKAPIRIHGSGRTDAGVHALGQVFHFDAHWSHAHDKLLAALRVGLPRAIQIKKLQPARSDFHARFHATGKRYHYRIHLGDADPFTRPYCWPVFRPLDIDAMQDASALLCGKYDFRAFTVLNGPPRANTIRDLRRFDIVQKGPSIRATAEAQGFLYKMVRSLVGVVVAVGERKLSLKRLKEIRDGHVRTAEVQTAPPQGLFLEKVFYRPSASRTLETLSLAGDSEDGEFLE